MKKILIVVDMQNDFIHGTLGTEEAKFIVPQVLEKISEYKKQGNEVVFTQDTHFKDYLDTMEGKKLPVVHCQKGTYGWELEASVNPCSGKRFEKNTFGSMDCMNYVSEGAYEVIEMVGLCTDICVISNAMLLRSALPQTPIIVDSRCCAGVTPESHRNALEAMKMCQIDVV